MHPSYREGLPVAVIEAMAAGLPCLCSRIRGNTDLIDSNGGAFFDPHCQESFIGALYQLLSADTASMSRHNAQAALAYDVQKINASLFEWVIENLSKNAVDAMGGKVGRITLRVEETDKCAVIEVSDTGKGIKRKDLNNVFRPGFTTKERGWGLGLSLAKRIVEEYHNGKIWVKSSEVGKGTTFRIELPLR